MVDEVDSKITNQRYKLMREYTQELDLAERNARVQGYVTLAIGTVAAVTAYYFLAPEGILRGTSLGTGASVMLMGFIKTLERSSGRSKRAWRKLGQLERLNSNWALLNSGDNEELEDL
jgi:hypothetical protein